MKKITFFYLLIILISLIMICSIDSIRDKNKLKEFNNFMQTSISQISICINENDEILQNEQFCEACLSFIKNGKKTAEELQRGEANCVLELKLQNSSFDYYCIDMAYSIKKDIVRLNIYDSDGHYFRINYLKDKDFFDMLSYQN